MISGLEKAADQDPLLFVPLFDRLFCCLPKSLREKLWCGIRYDELEFDENGHVIHDYDEERVRMK